MADVGRLSDKIEAYVTPFAPDSHDWRALCRAHPTPMNSTPTTEERIWAVLSHLSALAFGMGIALPVVGWSDQRRKSNYASFQSLQALGYQSLGYTAWALFSAVLTIILGVVFLSTLDMAGDDSGISDRRLSFG
ncbi:MAG: DUF4870 domain-containing protein, partial [Chloroflexota bacterium]|nr:DUF4870 domain-containing protein [Chloroflexota bacterium]